MLATCQMIYTLFTLSTVWACLGHANRSARPAGARRGRFSPARNRLEGGVGMFFDRNSKAPNSVMGSGNCSMNRRGAFLNPSLSSKMSAASSIRASCAPSVARNQKSKSNAVLAARVRPEGRHEIPATMSLAASRRAVPFFLFITIYAKITA